MLVGHRRPFLGDGFLDVPTHEHAHPGLRRRRKDPTQEHDGAQCAGFAVDRCLRLTMVVPDLDCEKTDD